MIYRLAFLYQRRDQIVDTLQVFNGCPYSAAGFLKFSFVCIVGFVSRIVSVNQSAVMFFPTTVTDVGRLLKSVAVFRDITLADCSTVTGSTQFADRRAD